LRWLARFVWIDNSWPTDLVNGDNFLGASSGPSAVAGYPIISVPAGFAFDLPLGISFLGRAFSEPTLIKLASGFEHVTGARRAPKFFSTLPLNGDRPRGRGHGAAAEFLQAMRDQITMTAPGRGTRLFGPL